MNVVSLPKSSKAVTMASVWQQCSHSARRASCASLQLGKKARISSAVQPFIAMAMESTYQDSLAG